MKKMLLSFLSLMGLGFSAFAQSHINIELLGATYTAPAVQFRVSWNAIPEGACHNSKIWLWVDFIKIENNQPSGTWTRATVANPSSGTVAAETNKGFWLQGATSGSYAATVTVTLTNIPANTTFNWCAYASDCPPFVIANNGTYTLQGTPPFILKAADGSTQTVTGKTLPAASLTIAAITLTDKTECPSNFCPYTGSDLYRDATHLCGHRPTGAQNWEAYIKDSRDNQIYRITQFSDGSWWFADDLKVADKRVAICNGYSLYKGDNKPKCPESWSIPTRQMFEYRFPIIWYDGNFQDEYGGPPRAGWYYWQSDSGCRMDDCCLDNHMNTYVVSDHIAAIHLKRWLVSMCNWGDCSVATVAGAVRCFRQL